MLDDCDQRCKHCYIFHGNNGIPLSRMSWDEIEVTLANCLDFCETFQRLPEFYITGGDPILHHDFWRLLERLHELGIPFTIMGNPFHLTAERCQRMHDLGRDRKAAILLAAKRLFFSQGFEGTGVEAIAKAAGMSKGLIYHYFRSKEDILLSFADEVDGYLTRLAQLGDPEEALTRFGVDFLVSDPRRYDATPPLQVLLISYADLGFRGKEHDAQNPILHDFGREYLGPLFGRCIAAGALREGDARAYGDIYWSFLMGKLLTMKKGRESEQPEVYVREALSVFKER